MSASPPDEGRGAKPGSGGNARPSASADAADRAAPTEAGPAAAKSREVAPGVHEIFLPLPARPSIINVYLLDCGGGHWALIDTGVSLEPSREALRGALRDLGVDPRSVTHLVATHHHPDHFGASAFLRSETGSRIHFHRLELEIIRAAEAHGSEQILAHCRRHGMPIPAEITRIPTAWEVWAGTFQPALEVDHFIEDGEVLELGCRRLRVVWTPGHAPGHCCLLDLDEQVLFAGDHLLPKITPHVGVYGAGPPNPLGDFLASQQKVAALDVRLVCPAHGPVFQDHRHRVRQILAHHDYRLMEIRDVIRAAPATGFAVAQKAFHWVFSEGGERSHIGAATMETLAHLELLRARGQATVEECDGVVFYRST